MRHALRPDIQDHIVRADMIDGDDMRGRMGFEFLRHDSVER